MGPYYFQGQMLVHLCLSVQLTVISLIVFICTVTYELKIMMMMMMIYCESVSAIINVFIHCLQTLFTNFVTCFDADYWW